MRGGLLPKYSFSTFMSHGDKNLDKMNNHNNENENQEQVREFLIAEYEALREARSAVLATSDNRANFFLASVSGATVVLALIGQLSGMGDIFIISSLTILPLLLLIGIFVFIRVIESHIANYIYVRGMNRIRRYFSEISPNIQKYLILPTYDDVPIFKSSGFNPSKLSGRLFDLTGVLALINSFITSIFLGGLTTLYFRQFTPLVIIAGLLIFVVVFVSHMIYESKRLDKAERETVVNFPKNIT